MAYTNKVKPAKKHYNKFVTRTQATWIFDKSTPVCEVLKSTVKYAKENPTMKPWYPTELAIAYGLKAGLIELSESKEANCYVVKLTDKGMIDIEKKQKTTCAFTGRRIRSGEF